MELNECQCSSSFGDINQGSDVCQQKLCYQTVDGSTINLDVINHQPLVCQEFIVTSPKFSYYRWMAWTVGFYALGCVLQLHLQVYKSINAQLCFVSVIFAQGICMNSGTQFNTAL